MRAGGSVSCAPVTLRTPHPAAGVVLAWRRRTTVATCLRWPPWLCTRRPRGAPMPRRWASCAVLGNLATGMDDM